MVEAGETALLGGRVRLLQPEKGYRAAIDPVFLAAAVPAGEGDRVLELGCGTGAALLCLAARVPGCVPTGLELQPFAAALARESATLTGVAGRVRVLEGDLSAPPPDLPANGFHHVMMNPPFYLGGRHTPSPHAHKAHSHGEGTADLAAWVQATLRFLKGRGTLTAIYPADRLEHLLALLASRFADIRLFPLWPRQGTPAKRVIVQARRDARGPTLLLPGLVLHGEGSGYTAGAEAVLRDAAPLDLSGHNPNL